MDARERVALELECEGQTTKCGINAAATAEAVLRSHQQAVEPLVPR